MCVPAPRWSGVSRHERYRKRCEDAGEDTTHFDADNPLPGFMDPITLEVSAKRGASSW